MFKLSKFIRRTPPPGVPCAKSTVQVLYCQWRRGNCCVNADRRVQCTGEVWERQMGR